MRSHPLRPTALEIAAGSLYGNASPGTASSSESVEPLAALEAAVLPALERPPCLVSFSGGRDSSIVLAVAAEAARRQGLEPPVPITLRFRDAPAAEESRWQERVTRHLGLSDWELREVDEELDHLGPVSAGVLRRHGVLYPHNAFLHLPLLEAARGGCLLTGFGGDHLFLAWRGRNLADLRARRRRPVPRDLLRLGYAASPAALRLRVARRRERGAPGWLRPGARDAVASLAARERVEQPGRWREWVPWRTRRRDLVAMCWSLGLLAKDAGALVIHPLLEPGFLAALARRGGSHGFGDRTTVMRELFSEILPDASLTRATKAIFGEVFWKARTREFAKTWDGSGVDPELVDPAALRVEWLQRSPDGHSGMLLQAAWLSRYGTAP